MDDGWISSDLRHVALARTTSEGRLGVWWRFFSEGDFEVSTMVLCENY